MRHDAPERPQDYVNGENTFALLVLVVDEWILSVILSLNLLYE